MWQAMFAITKVVSKSLPEDEGVTYGSCPRQGSFTLASRLTDDGQKIDVEHFAERHYLMPRSRRVFYPVTYTEMGSC